MPRWTTLYDELAGPRYPFLHAYAHLFTGDLEAADALVATALRRTFSRPRPLTDIADVEREVWHGIVTAFLARGSEHESRANAESEHARRNVHAPQDSGPAVAETPEARPRPAADHMESTFAPPPAREPADGSVSAAPTTVPTDSTEDRSAGAIRGDAAPDSATVTSAAAGAAGTDDAARASATDHDSRQAPADEPVASTHEPSMTRDEAELRDLLHALPPRTRVVAVLRHHDGLTPGQIGALLGIAPDALASLLADVAVEVRMRLGFTLPDEDVTDDGHAAEVTVAAHPGRS